MLLTLFLVLRELDHVGVTELQPTSGGDDLQVAGEHTQPVKGLLVLHFDGPLYTANVRRANRDVLATARLAPQWDELARDGRLFPTALAAARAYVGR